MPENKRRTPFERLTNHRKNERGESFMMPTIIILGVVPLFIVAMLFIWVFPSRNEVSSLSKNQATRAIIKQSCPIPGFNSLKNLSSDGEFHLGKHRVSLASQQGLFDDSTTVNLSKKGSKYTITNLDTKKILCTFNANDAARPFAEK